MGCFRCTIMWGQVPIEWDVYVVTLFGDKLPLIYYFYFGDMI